MSVVPGETPGDRPYGLGTVILLADKDRAGIWELFLGPEAVDDTDPLVE